MRVFVTIFIVLMLLSSVFAKTSEIEKARLKTPMQPEFRDDQVSNARHVRPTDGRNNPPQRDEILGERFMAGDTWYDSQSNGTVGKMIMKDNNDNIHITWMDGEVRDYAAGTRNMDYNLFENDEWSFDDGAQINIGTRGGYGSIWLTDEDPQRPMSFHHSVVDGNVTSY